MQQEELVAAAGGGKADWWYLIRSLDIGRKRSMARSAPLRTLWEGARSVILKQPKACSGGMGQIWAIGDLPSHAAGAKNRILGFTDGHPGQFFINFQNIKSDLTKL